jgi:hypothetical protein
MMWKFSATPVGERYAQDKARDEGLLYGRSWVDDRFYVGKRDELVKAGCRDILEP